MERLDAFMARANAAYYASHDPFADFVTSPEITQVFGELLGAWAAVVWQMMGAPVPVILAEAGPGRGTLMADALRAVRRVAPDFAAALRLHLVETSPRLRAVQAGVLPGAVWHDRVADLPDGPLILLANEFLDALPIRQFVRRKDGWAERFVVAGAFVEVAAFSEAGCDGAVATPPPAPPTRGGGKIKAPSPCGRGLGEGSRGHLATPEGTIIGTIIERNDEAAGIAAALGARLARSGGAALFLDYGPGESAPGDSLQALAQGAAADPLAAPGTADLTAHVDFQAVAEAARAGGGAAQGPVPQGQFLTRLGLFQRTGVIARTQPPARAARLIDAAQRLAEPDRMGRLFKALALCDPALPLLPGFAP